MRLTWHLLVFVLASCMVCSTLAELCTPSTCPPGPVRATFEHDNCTGDVQYSWFEDLMPCTRKGGSWKFGSFDDDFLYYYKLINNPTCDLTLPNTSYSYDRYTFGVCFLSSSKRDDGPLSHLFGGSSLERDSSYRASMVLPSVNASYVAPQEHPAPGNPNNMPVYMDYGGLWDECDGPHNCTIEEGSAYGSLTLSEYSEPGNCSSARSTELSRVQIGLCYYYGAYSYYVKALCETESVISTGIYIDDKCEHLYVATGERAVCEDTSQNYAIECTAAFVPPIADSPSPSPSYPLPPSGTSSSLSLTPIVIILSIVFGLWF